MYKEENKTPIGMSCSMGQILTGFPSVSTFQYFPIYQIANLEQKRLEIKISIRLEMIRIVIYLSSSNAFIFLANKAIFAKKTSSIFNLPSYFFSLAIDLKNSLSFLSKIFVESITVSISL